MAHQKIGGGGEPVAERAQTRDAPAYPRARPRQRRQPKKEVQWQRRKSSACSAANACSDRRVRRRQLRARRRDDPPVGGRLLRSVGRSLLQNRCDRLRRQSLQPQRLHPLTWRWSTRTRRSARRRRRLSEGSVIRSC